MPVPIDSKSQVTLAKYFFITRHCFTNLHIRKLHPSKQKDARLLIPLSYWEDIIDREAHGDVWEAYTHTAVLYLSGMPTPLSGNPDVFTAFAEGRSRVNAILAGFSSQFLQRRLGPVPQSLGSVADQALSLAAYCHLCVCRGDFGLAGPHGQPSKGAQMQERVYRRANRGALRDLRGAVECADALLNRGFLSPVVLEVGQALSDFLRLDGERCLCDAGLEECKCAPLLALTKMWWVSEGARLLDREEIKRLRLRAYDVAVKVRVERDRARQAEAMAEDETATPSSY
ncbi:uncharacterized protein BXZ73DRAFT_107054 [Epithele typhae]|uniref:uncharacterized protein n=1 Tax=Epithele typhae TaxID=378194 RepID=UPI002008482F|nr:uncharacterized protein BXZ73DRAFT_107054 [Epithele typhae]KAH9913077.1 hypothetical protein BXZ73DRAFT_107054 [Epithele typhae]